MKMKNALTGCLTMLTVVSALQAQVANTNLVSNGSFENTSNKKVHGWGEFYKADSLSSPNNTTADLYSKNSCESDFAVPQNYMGNQDTKTGNNYVGITAFYADDAGFLKTKPGYRKYSEYIQMPLTEPLVAGKAYTISFNASLAERSAYAVSGMGVYFSKEKVDINNNSFLNVLPHMVTTEIMTSKDWATYSGTYVATGGEKYLTLGCFENYMDTLKIIPVNVNNSRKAYYYIDDVSLSPVIIPADGITSILSGSCFRLDNLNFETDKAVIMANSYDELNSLVSFLKTYPYIMVYIDGHTDKTGTDAHNDKLSEERATAVVQYLTEHGISKDRLKARGYGETSPIDTTNANSLANRRVEITVCAANDFGAAKR
jgi:OOP family OmpA-OmpF porin